MVLHFERGEFERRLTNARAALRERDIAALLVFAPESQYYLTGFDTSGYVFFQCLVLTADDGPVTLLTRRPDLQQARHTSTIEDIRVWYDTVGADPTEALQDILAEKGLGAARVGVEMESFGLNARDYERLRRRFAGWCDLIDGSDLEHHPVNRNRFRDPIARIKML